MAKKNVTFADIAEYTGFSKTTISRYFNNPDSITLENQEKIANALEVLNYKENKLARVMANGRTEIIGVIIPNLYMHYYFDILYHIISTYEKYGYKFIVFAGNENADMERKYINELLAYKIEGLIILSHTLSSKELSEYNIPIVTIEREDEYVCSVNTDNYMGGIQAATVLAKSGCDILIHANADFSEYIPAYGRIKGFRDFCESNGFEHKIIIKDFGGSFEENLAEITKLFNELEKTFNDKKVGIFMPNDTHANILLNIIIRKYGTLPDKYNIVGFDNSSVSREAVIPITTVGQQVDKIAEETMEILLIQINERKKRRPKPLSSPIHKIITPVLVRRETTKGHL
ncbi:MAG: substrate-binding domain-containing protein [Oscillospiraceae bacterium]|nr:substrate-binding domain-containing protein [Oscillospiraceae bacterium]